MVPKCHIFFGRGQSHPEPRTPSVNTWGSSPGHECHRRAKGSLRKRERRWEKRAIRGCGDSNNKKYERERDSRYSYKMFQHVTTCYNSKTFIDVLDVMRMVIQKPQYDLGSGVAQQWGRHKCMAFLGKTMLDAPSNLGVRTPWVLLRQTRRGKESVIQSSRQHSSFQF